MYSRNQWFFVPARRSQFLQQFRSGPVAAVAVFGGHDQFDESLIDRCRQPHHRAEAHDLPAQPRDFGPSPMFGRVLPCASGGVCPEGSTTAITSGVGVNVSSIAATTSSFRSRKIPNPLIRTPQGRPPPELPPPKRIRSMTLLRFDTST